ncbi:MAG: zinc ribbon domain-containing protein [Ruminococcaceae bacterium]|nr:zinc ribbon domain-containing protein [Oscillospiraceae bacterium]
MFCSNCGTRLLENAVFCTNCGKKVADMPIATYSYQPTPVMVAPSVMQQHAEIESLRKSELSILEKVFEFFSKKQLHYDAYDDACEQVNKYARGTSNALIIWGSIFTAFLVLMGVISPREIVMCLILGIPAILMLIGGILLKVNARNKLHYYLEGYANLSQELYNNYLEFEDCPIVAEYTNPRILYSISHLIKTCRANTINEAINILNSQTNAALVTRHITEIKKNTFEINAQTRVPVIFAPSKFFD